MKGIHDPHIKPHSLQPLSYFLKQGHRATLVPILLGWVFFLFLWLLIFPLFQRHLCLLGQNSRSSVCSLLLAHNSFFFFFAFFRAAPAAYASFQARGQFGAANCQSTEPQPQRFRIWATSETYATAHSNTKSITPWARQGWNLHPHGY